jgi:hypothetical protein
LTLCNSIGTFRDRASATNRSIVAFSPAESWPARAIHASLGQEEDTLHSLESAVADHSSALPYLDVDPLFDGVRTNPRFKTITQCLGLG